MKKVVGIIGTNGLPGKYGGWDQLVIHLTQHLKEKFNFIVYTSYANTAKGTKEYNGTGIKVVPFKANGFQSIPYDVYSIIHALFFCDVLFICGTSGCIFLPVAKLFNKKIILNPDGQEWKRRKWNRFAQTFLSISERLGVRNSNIVVADNKKIQEYLYLDYKRMSVLIEYGGDQAIKVPLSDETKLKYSIMEKEYAFKVCRIEPENNIDMILNAFSKTPEINLILIGNWNNSNYGILLRERFNDYHNLKLLDPIYNQISLDELRSNCGFYVHGHSVGGTNPSLVEAMNLGLNILAFDVEFNKETTEGRAHYFRTESDLVSLVFAFENKLLIENGNEMYNIAKRRYKWSIITEKYAQIFS